MPQITVIFFTVCILCVSADPDDVMLNPQIVAGHDASIKDHPYIVSIRQFNYHICGGSIFSPRLIVTAAHCMSEKSLDGISIVAGSANLDERDNVNRSVVKAVIHPDYASEKLDYDVALLVLESPLTFNKRIRPIELASSRPDNGENASIAGWGYKYEYAGNTNHLQMAYVRIMSNQICEKSYTDSVKVTLRMVCAEGTDTDACQNDSGGPLVYDNKLLGIVSFGRGCASGSPGVYTSVPDISEWIYKESKIL